MKKFFVSIIAAVLLFNLFTVTSSATETVCEHINVTTETTIQEADCYHAYEKSIVTTCLDCGQKWKSYEKGFSYYHAETESVTEITPPTCTSCGWFRYHKECKLCGATVDGAIQPIAEIVHDADADGNIVCYSTRQVSVGANCDSYGYIDTIIWCDVCDCEVSRTREVLPMSEHFWSDWELNDEGICERHCRSCGKTKTANSTGAVALIRQFVVRLVQYFNEIKEIIAV